MRSFLRLRSLALAGMVALGLVAPARSQSFTTSTIGSDASTIWRDWCTDGVPYSCPSATAGYNPKKSDIRQWGATIGNSIEMLLGNQAGGSYGFDTQAHLFGNLLANANALATVFSDPTTANNGVYIKNGASGTGSWTQVTTTPYGIIPTWSIATVTQLPAGSTPTVTVGGSPSNPNFSFGLPAAPSGSFNWRGAWSSSASYAINDIVYFGGDTYIAIANSTNVSPTNTSPWNYFTRDSIIAANLTGYLYGNGAGAATASATIPLANLGQPVYPQVANVAALKALSTATFSEVTKLGYNVAGDAGQPINYVASSSACSIGSGAGDDASQVQSADSKCWIGQFPATGVDVRLWGADPLGVNDSAPNFFAAYSANVGPVLVPQGVYSWRTAETFSGTKPNFIGVGWGEYNQNLACPSASGIQGSWIHIGSAQAGINPITFSGSNAQGSTGFNGIAFCQDQPAPASFTASISGTTMTVTAVASGTLASGQGIGGSGLANGLAITALGTGTGGTGTYTISNAQTISSEAMTSWAPTVYNPVFTFSNMGGEVDLSNVYFYGIYDAVSALTGVQGRFTFTHIRGQVYHSFLNADNIQDTLHATDFHLWPYFNNNQAVIAWSQTNGDAFTLARVDGINAPDMFILGFRSCLHFTSSSNGITTGANFGSFYCDQSRYPVWITGNNTTLQIANAYINGGNIPGSNGIIDQSSGSTEQIGQLHCSAFGGSCTDQGSSTGADTLSIGSALVADFNQDNNGSAAFTALTATYQNVLRIATAPQLIGSNNGGPTLYAASTALYSVPIRRTWTPGVAGSTTAGTPTFNTDVGYFQYTDQTAYVQGQFNLATFGGTPAGNALITGLPYAAVSAAINPGNCTIGYSGSITLDTGYTELGGLVSSGGTTIQLEESGAGKSTQNLPVSGLGTTGIVEFSCHYSVF